MRKLTILLMILALGLIAVPMAQAETLQFASITLSGATGSQIVITGTGTPNGTIGFTQALATNPVTGVPLDKLADFEIGASNFGDANGDIATISPSTGAYVISGGINSEGTGRYSSVSGSASLTIFDHFGGSLTADLQMTKIETNPKGTDGTINDEFVINLSNVVYNPTINGTDRDLQALAASGDELALYIGFAANGTLDFMTEGGNQDFSTYHGSIVPLPPTALLMGTGLLGLVGLGWRRRKTKV